MLIFPRPDLEDSLWKSLHSGSHLLIPGPRRIGKTTLLKQALTRPGSGFFPVYVFVESVDSVDELYRKLLSALLDQEFVGRLSRASRRFTTWVKKVRIDEIGAKVRFGASGAVDHLAEFVQFCGGLELDGRIVLMVDELSQAVENALGSKSARNNGIHSRSLTNLAVEHRLLELQVNLMGILKHDGYLNNQEDPARYRFNSPVIREWWWRNVAN